MLGCASAPPKPAPPAPEWKPIVNYPTEDADIIRLPVTLRNNVRICVQVPYTADQWACEPLGNLRSDLLAQRNAN